MSRADGGRSRKTFSSEVGVGVTLDTFTRLALRDVVAALSSAARLTGRLCSPEPEAKIK